MRSTIKSTVKRSVLMLVSHTMIQTAITRSLFGKKAGSSLPPTSLEMLLSTSLSLSEQTLNGRGPTRCVEKQCARFLDTNGVFMRAVWKECCFGGYLSDSAAWGKALGKGVGRCLRWTGVS
ncbi:hypothetical protein LINGRAPRIM_LOCUS57 [Linum grandiflorum]